MRKTKKRRQFALEFKQDAVKLAEKIGVTATAEKLGIHPNNLHKIRDFFRADQLDSRLPVPSAVFPAGLV